MKYLYFAGIGAGAVYGVLMRLLMDRMPAGVLSIAFLTAVPAAIGYLAVDLAWRARPRTFWKALMLGWPALLLANVAAMATFLEGAICVVFALPIALFFCSLGGLAAWLVLHRRAGAPAAPLTMVLLLPLLLAPTENRHRVPVDYRSVKTSIVIHAPPQAVWNQIVTVPAIDPAQLPFSWARAIGFPRPIAATIEGAGVGAVRHARFAHGLTFIETVDEWQPEQRLGFRIHALTAEIPPTTMDEHVRVGGTYFDVLHGEYRIEPLKNGGVILHLVSRERVSTDLNLYASFWADAVMRDIQHSILVVIRKRAEGK